MNYRIMQLARTILQTNIDPTFVDEILANPSVARKKELVYLLQQWKQTGFNTWLLDYMFLDYEDIIKSAMIPSYHPVFINHIRDYTKKQWFEYRNIDNCIFPDVDYFYDFFAPNRELGLSEEEKEKIAAHAFDQTSLLLWSAFFYNHKDALYFSFSKIKKNPVNAEGKMTINFIEKWFANAEREWMPSVALYIKEKFPDQSLFDILSLNPNDIL